MPLREGTGAGAVEAVGEASQHSFCITSQICFFTSYRFSPSSHYTGCCPLTKAEPLGPTPLPPWVTSGSPEGFVTFQGKSHLLLRRVATLPIITRLHMTLT